MWTVRAFSRHQQKLAAEWLKDETFAQEILQALASCLASDDPTLLLDGGLAIAIDTPVRPRTSAS